MLEVDNGQKLMEDLWVATSAKVELPDALKPAFFGALPWPWVDATGAVKTATLPAKARFDAGAP